jgi:hypothetical protein
MFAPGKVKSVTYVSGEKALQVLSEKINKAQYQVEWPVGSQAKILRRAELSCFPTSGCMAALLPQDNAMIRQNASQPLTMGSLIGGFPEARKNRAVGRGFS